MSTVEHGLLVRSADGRSVVGHGIGSFRGEPTGRLEDVLAHLQQIQDQGWQLVAVETAPDETRYWLTRPKP